VKLDSIQASTQTGQADKQHGEEAAINRRIARYTGALVGIGFLQALFFLWQLWMIRKSLADTEIAAKAARRSAKATQRSVETMEDTARKQLRAYVMVEFGRMVKQDLDTLTLAQWYPRITNTGATPAHRLIATARMDVLGLPLPPEYYLAYNFGTIHSRATLHPRQRNTVTCAADRLFMEEEELARLRDGTERALYIYGRVEYLDIYDAPHHTNFCFWAIWKADDSLAPGGITSRGNDAD
jgi:hypothetical protein